MAEMAEKTGKTGRGTKRFFGMTRADILLGIGFLIAGAISIAALSLYGGGEGATVEVKVAGELTGIYSLQEDRVVKIPSKGENTLVIKNGRAFMSYADCPDQYCVRHRPISKNGESIICLPNKVVVTVKGGEEQEVDAVVN